MAEFDLIERIRGIVCAGTERHRLAPVTGIGDDAAVLEVPAGKQLVVTTDTLLEGTHFFAGADPHDLGHKSLAVNLSDLAAMGAEPAWFFLALTLPELDQDWLDEFAAGLAGLAAETGIILAGGDTTAGPLSVTITALGLVGRGEAITRSGARTGDLVLVSGTLGDAALALRELASGGMPGPGVGCALHRPKPRLGLGLALRGLATACVDVSDGLWADLGHILTASGRGAEIRLQDLPCSGDLHGLNDEDRHELQLSGGDDYELCFTLGPEHADQLQPIMDTTGVTLTVIGYITDSGRLLGRSRDGKEYRPSGTPYEHFATVRASMK